MTILNKKKNNDITLTPGKNIVLSNVGFSYGDNTTLEDINMIIKPGTKTAFVGESGSGKSTLVKLILGLYSNYSGNIKYDTYDIDAIPTDEMLKITTLITMIAT